MYVQVNYNLENYRVRAINWCTAVDLAYPDNYIYFNHCLRC